MRRRNSTVSTKKRLRIHPGTKIEPGADSKGKEDASDINEQRVFDLEMEVARLHQKLKEFGARTSLLEAHSSLFMDAPMGYAVIDQVGLIHVTNCELRRILGIPVAELVHGSFNRFLAREHLRNFLNHLSKARYAIAPVRTAVVLRNMTGHTLPVELISIAVPWEDRKRIYTAVLDISKQSQVQTALARTQDDFRLLLDTIQGIVWEAEATTLDITYVSSSIQSLLGYPPEDWYQKGFWLQHIYGADRDRVLRALAKVSRDSATSVIGMSPSGERNVHLEFRMIGAKRQLVWIHSNFTLRPLGPHPKFFAVGVDISERKRAEEDLQNAHAQLEKRVEERTTQLRESVSQLEAFSYTLSHDMRAPLRSIHGFCEMLRNGLQDRLKPVESNLFDRVTTSANRLDRLIQDVLHYTKVTRAAVELRVVNLEQIIDTTIREHPSFQEKAARIDIVRPLLPVLGHEALLSQCFSNLLSNAIKFVPPGQQPQIRVRAERVDQNVRVTIEDNGIGITTEDQKRVFSIFQRFHKSPNLYEGTGIGLAIVAKAVERMKGSLGVESSPGKGSQFWFQLRAA